MVSFTIPGAPVGKGRPRATRTGHVYTPDTTVTYENLVKLMWQDTGAKPFDADRQLAVKINAVYSIPKSVSNKRRAAMMEGTIRPTKKPDIDNVVKIICDALNGLAYHDDSQIVYLAVEKWYGAIPCVKVEVDEL